MIIEESEEEVTIEGDESFQQPDFQNNSQHSVKEALRNLDKNKFKSRSESDHQKNSEYESEEDENGSQDL